MFDYMRRIGRGITCGLVFGFGLFSALGSGVAVKAEEDEVQELNLEEQIDMLMSLPNAYLIMSERINNFGPNHDPSIGQIINIEHDYADPYESLDWLRSEVYDDKECDGVLVFFYANKSLVDERSFEFTKRVAYMWSKTSDEFRGRVKIVAYHADWDKETYDANNRIFVSWGMKSWIPEHPYDVIRGSPSIALFKDGEHIDTIYGGPSENKHILSDLSVLINSIKQCIFGKIFKKGHLYLFKNTYKPKPYKI